MALSFGLSLVSQAITAGGATLNLQFAGATALDPRITFTRASSATFTGSDGLLQTAAVNAPRLTYNPTTLAAEGLLVEEQRTNLLLYSSLLVPAWTSDDLATLVPNATTSPDGSVNAPQLQYISNVYRYTSTTTVASTAYVYTLYAKLGTGGNNTITLNAAGVGAVFNLSTKTVSGVTAASASIQDVAGGWLRCGIVFTSVSTSTFVDFVMNGTFTTGQGHYFWGAQLEAGAFATSYIPTTTAQATRAADFPVMTGTNFSSWFNADEGSIFASYIVPAALAGTQPCAVSIDNGTSSNRIQIRSSNGTSFGPRMVMNGTSVLSATGGTSQLGVVAKEGIAYKTGSSASYGNGTLVESSATAFNGQTLTQMVLGTGQVSACINGTIKSITYYPRRLANTELQALTS